jgi:hypothetical protein
MMIRLSALAVALSVGLGGTARAQTRTVTIPPAVRARLTANPRAAVRPPRRSAAQLIARVKALTPSTRMMHLGAPITGGASAADIVTAERPTAAISGGGQAALSLTDVDLSPASGGRVDVAFGGQNSAAAVELSGVGSGQVYALLVDLKADGPVDVGSQGLVVGTFDPANWSGTLLATCTAQQLMASKDGNGIMSCPAVLTMPSSGHVTVGALIPSGSSGLDFVDVSFVRIR